MSQRFRNSFIGYKKNAADMQLEVSKSVYCELLADKQKILDDLTSENKALIEERNAILAGSIMRDQLNVKLQETLYNGFIDSFKRIFQLENEIQHTIESSNNKINLHKAKSNILKNKIKDFAVQIESDIDAGSE